MTAFPNFEYSEQNCAPVYGLFNDSTPFLQMHTMPGSTTNLMSPIYTEIASYGTYPFGCIIKGCKNINATFRDEGLLIIVETYKKPLNMTYDMHFAKWNIEAWTRHLINDVVWEEGNGADWKTFCQAGPCSDRSSGEQYEVDQFYNGKFQIDTLVVALVGLIIVILIICYFKV